MQRDCDDKFFQLTKNGFEANIVYALKNFSLFNLIAEKLNL